MPQAESTTESKKEVDLTLKEGEYFEEAQKDFEEDDIVGLQDLAEDVEEEEYFSMKEPDFADSPEFSLSDGKEEAMGPLRELKLPTAKDPALVMYGIRLEGQGGYWPAAEVRINRVRRVNWKNPVDTSELPRVIRDVQDVAAWEKAPRRYEIGSDGKPTVYNNVRVWRNLAPHYTDRRYFEDKGLAGNTSENHVVRVSLYCPVREKQNGAPSDHGPYAGVGQETAHDPRGEYEPGTCPMCNRDKRTKQEFRIKALRKIRDMHRDANIDPSPALAMALMRSGVV